MLPITLLDSTKAGELLYKFVHITELQEKIYFCMGTDWDKLLIPGCAVSLATNCATSKPKMGYANHNKINYYSFSVITEIFSALKFQSHISFYFLYMVRSEKSSSDNVDKYYIEMTRLGKNI